MPAAALVLTIGVRVLSLNVSVKEVLDSTVSVTEELPIPNVGKAMDGEEESSAFEVVVLVV